MSKDKYGNMHSDGHYSKMTGNDKNVCYSIYDKRPDQPGHSATHINYNTETGKESIVEHGSDGKSSKTDTTCYITTACMKQFLDSFNDDCYELTVLRWFRDNFVPKKDIKHYYETAPMIVEAIENGNYEFAYNRYKESILNLEQTYLKTPQKNLTKVLKKQTINIHQ